ncbi:unnamed protein product [Adineta steineri]|uniref:Uncharacterized protein n=1 Tax=Adineta steineri TaxID=433720 RepID=A0A813ZIL6_9BILA|nr:unnamed protein product [Adineta steineri]CAF4130607.1 unnamed protein product [Adineta steineri]
MRPVLILLLSVLFCLQINALAQKSSVKRVTPNKIEKDLRQLADLLNQWQKKLAPTTRKLVGHMCNITQQCCSNSTQISSKNQQARNPFEECLSNSKILTTCPAGSRFLEFLSNFQTTKQRSQILKKIEGWSKFGENPRLKPARTFLENQAERFCTAEEDQNEDHAVVIFCSVFMTNSSFESMISCDRKVLEGLRTEKKLYAKYLNMTQLFVNELKKIM